MRHVKLKVSEQVGEQPTEQVNTPVSTPVSTPVQKLLLAIDGNQLTISALQSIMDVKSKKYIRKNMLDVALEQNLIVSSNPDTPNHPRQKYYLTEKGKAVLGQVRATKMNM